jgi:hypothetical protein
VRAVIIIVVQAALIVTDVIAMEIVFVLVIATVSQVDTPVITIVETTISSGAAAALLLQKSTLSATDTEIATAKKVAPTAATSSIVFEVVPIVDIVIDTVAQKGIPVTNVAETVTVTKNVLFIKVCGIITIVLQAVLIDVIVIRIVAQVGIPVTTVVETATFTKNALGALRCASSLFPPWRRPPAGLLFPEAAEVVFTSARVSIRCTPLYADQLPLSIDYMVLCV